MEELGLNWLLCRFYKGMGWEEEKKDFPNVKRFVENCHKHGVKAVAYVQFSTVYPETMKREIPNLEDWAARKANGDIYYYSRYFRWEPCFNEPAYEEYLKKVIKRCSMRHLNKPPQKVRCARLSLAFGNCRLLRATHIA
jgi:hypothetical protein